MKRMMDEIDPDGAPFLVPRTYTGMGCSIHRKTSMSTPTLQLCKRNLSSKNETDQKKMSLRLCPSLLLLLHVCRILLLLVDLS